MMRIPFDNTYARLPERFFERRPPVPVAAARLHYWNEELAAALGLGAHPADKAELADIFGGNRIPEGAEPLAQAYAGHQFGHFQAQLGDGRALLLGEVRATDGRRFDLALKGSGPTRFSRRGDGRAALGPMMREVLLGEAMHALGIPTTRALALVATGEYVQRENFLPGAVLTRVAASHLRVGTFQYFAAREDTEAIRLLADYAIDRHYPEARQTSSPYLSLLERVVAGQARLIAQWLQVGFIHGVMNTDNMAISGETIDYGPCAFLDAFDPAACFSSIDSGGRYAYGQQPLIAQWNLTRFAECLLPLLDSDPERSLNVAQTTIARFGPEFESAHLQGMGRKFGFARTEETDGALIESGLALVAKNEADFTLAFDALAAAVQPGGEAELTRLLPREVVLADWLNAWRTRLAREDLAPEEIQKNLRAVNPGVIPRNHQVERAIVAAEQRQDFTPFHELLRVTRQPFAVRPEDAAYRAAPRSEERVTATFCGT